MGVFTIGISGGEPLLRKDFFKIIDILSKTSMYPCLATNGTLITSEIAKKLRQYSFMDFAIQVSLDGATPPIHDRIRGKGSFAKAIEGLKNLISEDLHPTIGFVAMHDNACEIDGIFELAFDMNVDCLHFIPLMPSGRAKKLWFKLMPSHKEYKFVVKQIAENAKKFPKIRVITEIRPSPLSEINYEPLTTIDKKFSGCGGGRTECVIDPDGNIIPCSLLRDPLFINGNTRYFSFREIWNNPRSFCILRKRPVKVLNTKCKNCNSKYICHGGCTANAYHLLGEPQAPDPTCPYS